MSRWTNEDMQYLLTPIPTPDEPVVQQSDREMALASEAEVPFVRRLHWVRVMRSPLSNPAQKALAAVRLYGDQCKREAAEES